MSAARKGCIHPYQRDFNGEIPILVAHTTPSEEYTINLQETLKKQLSDATRKDYRRRINRILKYWKDKHNDYYSIG